MHCNAMESRALTVRSKPNSSIVVCLIQCNIFAVDVIPSSVRGSKQAVRSRRARSPPLSACALTSGQQSQHDCM